MKFMKCNFKSVRKSDRNASDFMFDAKGKRSTKALKTKFLGTSVPECKKLKKKV